MTGNKSFEAFKSEMEKTAEILRLFNSLPDDSRKFAREWLTRWDRDKSRSFAAIAEEMKAEGYTGGPS